MTGKSGGAAPQIDEILALDDARLKAKAELQALNGTDASEGMFRKAMSVAEYTERMLEKKAIPMAETIRQQREVIEKMDEALADARIQLIKEAGTCNLQKILDARKAAAPFRATTNSAEG